MVVRGVDVTVRSTRGGFALILHTDEALYRIGSGAKVSVNTDRGSITLRKN